jgi:hypothetical protein
VAQGVEPKKRSPFKGHVQRGRRHPPPWRDMPVQMTLREFRKVALPDFLWLLTMLHARPLLAGPGATGRALDLAQAAMKRAHARGAVAGDQAPVFHGLLTDWERLPEQERAEVLEEFRRRGIYDDVVPETFAHALAVYSEPPGRWLIEPRLQAGLVPSTKEAEKLLWELVRLGGSSHQPLATHAIYLWIVALVKMDRIRHGGEPVFIDILPRYPNNVNDAERSIAESTLRAMFLPAFHNRPEAAETQEWCQRFWRANRALYECYRKEPEPPDPTDLEKVEIGYARCARLQREFLVAARDTDPDLWDSDRYDVLTGMAWRALRMAGHLIGHPAQWSEEHGYSAIRGLFEAIVQMRWMLAVEETRPGVWNEFKDYGRGRTKALKLHTEEALQKATGMPKEILAGLLPKLEEEVNRDISGDFQDISTASTFIDNKSLFAMAEEVDMGDLYNSTMGPASSATHGDWSALDDLFLDRCLHLLHGRHAIPRFELAAESDERLPFLAETYATWALNAYLKATGHERPAGPRGGAESATDEEDPTGDPGSDR